MIALLAALSAACTGIQFSSRDNGRSHPYRVAAPALKVITDPDCKMTAEVISIPGRVNYLWFRNGLGKSNSSVIFEPGGTIKQVSADQQGITDDIVKLVGLARQVAGVGVLGSPGKQAPTADKCPPSVAVYPILFDEVSQTVWVAKDKPILQLGSPIK